ncbi:ABC transporter substrate-binding protein [Streptomyces sp. AC558_RSS880]|uniref:ABC transporter substrate-binding protein n=1 Tax=Streptomyces sp. AC558_RSS880 TaxID=2823687 RepID=UPI001C24A0A2
MWPSPGKCSSWPRPPETRPDITAAPAPIRIGYRLSLTGSLADDSGSARLAHEIWREDTNSRGGLLGLPVEFVRYDDQENADNVPRIHERLIDEHDVELVLGGYGTDTLLPAMPLILDTLRAAEVRPARREEGPAGDLQRRSRSPLRGRSPCRMLRDPRGVIEAARIGATVRRGTTARGTAAEYECAGLL